ncbi:hypothetical protein BDQ94DRAFT_117075 [Aspergillus welwitschiae]|uniref:Uncharacterized protein n=1 Tax=Aspergillus welwitschiae TaxID=1341132 RepID=A0A3F3PKV6_9EURO|nr:hypothetical protein BDQ94DRAFT_117075 [Aspergillus welwitschiae]RDH27412.1 hypothetical protein BDQ94DRAFT_117075 [Aspergillus welwitschiae]
MLDSDCVEPHYSEQQTVLVMRAQKGREGRRPVDGRSGRSQSTMTGATQQPISMRQLTREGGLVG